MPEEEPQQPTLDIDRVTSRSSIDLVHYLSDVASTNDAALVRVLQAPAGHTELFVTDRQSSGRGRGRNAWWSPPGSLAFTALTRELKIETARLAQASLAVGVAICEALEEFLPQRAMLKWPNDVYLGGRKVAGILIEAPAGPVTRLVTGVGINVNNSAREAPQPLRETAIGMVDVASPRNGFDRTEVLIACLAQIDKQLRRLEVDDAGLSSDWVSRSLLTRRSVRLERVEGVAEGSVEGIVETIADDGALVIATAEGTRRCYGGVVASW